MSSRVNCDDLGEYRPGLEAARLFGARHPHVEAGIAKSGVRSLSRSLGLLDLAELPASPCLSSRVETMIPIEAATLSMIHEVERLVADALQPTTARRRVRSAGPVVELDANALDRAMSGDAELRRRIADTLSSTARVSRLSFAPYRTGSAFVGALPS